MARTVKPGDFMSEIDSMMNNAIENGDENFWFADYVISFKGIECHMPNLADVHEYLSEFLDAVHKDLEPDWIDTNIETGYVPELDMTIIKSNTYQGGQLIKEEIIGFYHGEPNDEDTKTYANKGVVCKL